VKTSVLIRPLCLFAVLLIICGSVVQTIPTTSTILQTDVTKRTVDLIIFSYDRPLQLYAFLESVQHYITGLESCTVIYRTSNSEFDKAYNKVSQAFPNTVFRQEHANTQQKDFKSLLINSVTSGRSPYIVFAVDDMITKQYVNLEQCTSLLEQTGAYGFFLRLGTNLNYCYPLSCAQPVPPLTEVSQSVYSWTFKDGSFDWNYSHTVDMTVYRKNGILAAIEKLNYHNPNTFDVAWSKIAHTVTNRQGLCFADSAIINLPLNRVQNEHNNRYANTWTSEQLLSLFDSNLKIDIHQFAGIKNDACHVVYNINFICRDNTDISTKGK
jgi:hypothetical protein